MSEISKKPSVETKNEIDIVENDIDQIWHNLTICKFPLHLALFMELSFFTHYFNDPQNKTNGPSSRTNARQGLQLLIPNFFKNCPQKHTNKRIINELRNTN